MPGDGVGNDVMEAARIVLDRMKFDAEYVPCDIGWEFWCKEGNALPDRTVKALKETTCASLRRDHEQAAGQSERRIEPGTQGQRAGLFLADRRAAAVVQSPYQHAAVQKLSRQSAELSRQQDHESRAAKTSRSIRSCSAKIPKACTAASSFSRCRNRFTPRSARIRR